MPNNVFMAGIFAAAEATALTIDGEEIEVSQCAHDVNSGIVDTITPDANLESVLDSGYTILLALRSSGGDVTYNDSGGNIVIANGSHMTVPENAVALFYYHNDTWVAVMAVLPDDVDIEGDLVVDGLVAPGEFRLPDVGASAQSFGFNTPAEAVQFHANLSGANIVPYLDLPWWRRYEISTTDDTPADITSYSVDEDTVVILRGKVIAKRDDVTECYTATFEASARREGTDPVVLVGSPTINAKEDSSGTPAFDIAVTGSSSGVHFEATGESGKNYDWTLSLEVFVV